MSLGQASASNEGAMSPVENGSSGQQPSAAVPGTVSPGPTAPLPEGPAADSSLDVEPPSPPKKPNPKPCGVCDAQPGKYKCPRCSMPYCSVACSKLHKENHPPDPPNPDPSTLAPDNSSNDAKPAAASEEDPYGILLEHRATFQQLFERYPSLPSVLTRIQEKTLPPGENGSGPLSRFPSLLGPAAAGAGRKRHQPWTRDVGLRRGADALRRARTDPGDTGDGVREFCDLVLMLLAKQGGDKGGGAAVGRVREEVVAEETRLIERLLREEGG